MNENLKPETILIDYEIGAKNALKEVFTLTTVKGSFFYLSQYILEKHKKLGYKVNIKMIKILL